VSGPTSCVAKQLEIKMKNQFNYSVMALTLALLFSDVSAQESNLMLDTVTVLGKREGALPASVVLTSVDVMGSEMIEDKNVKNSWELLGQMPGTSLKSWQMGLESGKPAFRGFNGAGYVNGIKLLIDGVPSNSNSGNMRHLDMVFPLDIDYIEVVRGTNDPRYGLYNIGGNINVATKQGGNYRDARVSYGSFNTRDIQATLGIETDDWQQNYFFSKYNSDGYRDHSSTDKYGFGGKWFYAPKQSDLKVGIIVRAFDGKADEAGYLRPAEYAADPTQYIASRNSGDHDLRRMNHISAHIDYAFTNNLMSTAKIYMNTLNDDRYVTYPYSTIRSENRKWDETHYGLLSTLTWKHSQTLTLDGGVNFEQQDNEYRRYRWGSGSGFAGSPSSCTNTPVGSAAATCQNYTVENVGAYMQAIILPTERLKIIPAMRFDRFDGQTTLYSVANPNGVSYDLNKYGWINQPKLSIVYKLTTSTSVYANWGKTFQILTGGAANTAYAPYGSTLPLTAPSINTGKEVGLKFNFGTYAEGRIAVWQQDATNEAKNLAAADDATPLGATRRRGIDFQVSSQLSRDVKIWMSHSVQQAKVVSGVNSLIGKDVAETPRYISNVGVDVRPSEKWRFGISGRAQSSYYIADDNSTGRFGQYTLFDASARYQYSKNMNVDLQVRNLMDRRYASDVWTYPGLGYDAYYSAGAPRAFYLSVTTKF
jgi:iron complex outermembrane receptor protein